MTEIRVPTLGESVTEATIGRWFKKAGDPVAVDEPLVELETDKVTIEVHQGLIDGDGIAGLLEPAADGGLGDGFAERRHTNFSHGLFPKRSLVRS